MQCRCPIDEREGAFFQLEGETNRRKWRFFQEAATLRTSFSSYRVPFVCLLVPWNEQQWKLQSGVERSALFSTMRRKRRLSAPLCNCSILQVIQWKEATSWFFVDVRHKIENIHLLIYLVKWVLLVHFIFLMQGVRIACCRNSCQERERR